MKKFIGWTTCVLAAVSTLVIPVLSTFFSAASAVAIFASLPVVLGKFLIGAVIAGPMVAVIGWFMTWD